MQAPPRPFRHTLRVRFGEVDKQGVVFNAHYVAYIDDTLENWLEAAEELKQRHRWDMMLKKLQIEWISSVGNADRLDIDVGILRWGGSSWTAGYHGSCRGEAVFRAEVLYVSVELGVNRPLQTPDDLRQYMGPEMTFDEIAAGPPKSS